MQYKLEKKYWKVCLSLFFCILTGPSLFASTTAAPASPYVRVTSGASNYAFFAYSASPPTLVSGTTFVDTQAGFKSVSYTVTPSNALYFEITTDLTENSTEDYFVGVYAVPSNGDEEDFNQYIPIDFAAKNADSNPTSCSECVSSASSSELTFARISGATKLRIGFYPEELCRVTSSTGCTGLNATVPTATTPTSFSLIFRIGKLDNLTSATTFDNQSNEEQKLTLSMIQAEPSVSCTDLENGYTPGDGFINVNMSKITGTTASAGAPVSTLVLLGNIGSSVYTSYDTYAANSLRAYAEFSVGTKKISGFQNTTNGTDKSYTVTFAVRDHAGILKFNNNCTLSNVQTSEIEGTITQGDCFIATALFQSKEAWPVKILRNFRDRYLIKNKYGAQFVDLYYHYSPAIAKWIQSRPLLGFFGVLLLFPFVIVVYFILNPFIFILFIGVVLGAILFSRKMRIQNVSNK